MRDNDMVNPPGSGAWEYIETVEITTGTPLQIENLEQGVVYKLIFMFQPTNNTLYLRFNSDAGANYAWANHGHGDNVGALHGESHASGANWIQIHHQTEHDYTGHLFLYSLTSASNVVHVHGMMFGYRDLDEYATTEFGGRYTGAAGLSTAEFHVSATSFAYAWVMVLRLIQATP